MSELATSGSLAVDLLSEATTAGLAARLAAVSGPGDVLALRGDLGTGKTSFARAFIRALAGPQEEVPSPTFTLVQTYDTPRGAVWHFDLYRLSTPDDVIELGFEEALAGGMLLIEWPDRLGRLLPARRLDVSLALAAAPAARSATLAASGGSDLIERMIRGAPT